MKPQSTAGALPTEQLLLSMEPIFPEDDCKLDLSRCAAIALQLAISLGACGVLHWAMT